MKKIIAILCAFVIMFAFAACGKKECEVCGKEAKTKKYTYQGESAYLCKDCGSLLDLAKSMAK